MIKTRSRKILKDVLSRKGRTALVATAILIGVFGAVSLISVNDLLVKQIEDDITSDEIAMVRLYVTVPSAGTNVTTESGEDQVLALVRGAREQDSQLRGLAGVTTIEGQAAAPVFWKKPGSGDEYENADIVAFSEPFDSIQIEPMRLVDGVWPQVGVNEIAIERRMADDYGLSVGDTMQFRPLGGDAAADVEWTITATVFHPYWFETGRDESQPEIRIYANFEDAQTIAGFSGFKSYYLRYADTQTGHDQADALETVIAENTNYIPEGYWLDDPDSYFLIHEVQEVTNILNILAIVSLVVSGFLVTNVISSIVIEQKRQIGVMKSLGATRRDNFFIYAGVALTYGIIGTIPGVILGVLVGAAMAQELAPLAFTLIDDFQVSTMGVVIGAVMGLLVPIAAALFPVLSGTRVTIIEAVTDLGISAKWGKGIMARVIKRLPFPANIRQALSNVVQKKGRLMLTVITLTFAAAAFMGVFAMFTVITDEIDRLFNTFQFEALIVPTEPQDFDTVKNLILEVDGVKDVYPGVGFGLEIINLDSTDSSYEIEALGYDPAAPVVDLDFTEGVGWQDDPTREGIVITSAAAKILDAVVGDRVLVSAGGRSGEYDIIGVVSFPFEQVFMRWQDLSHLAGFVYDGGTPDDVSDDVPLPVAFLIAMEQSDPTIKEVDAVIDAVSERLLNKGITSSFENEVEQQESEAENMMTFNMIFQLTSAVMAAVGAIGLLTTLSMAVFERQKEIGVMRSIGAGSWTIITQFQVEGIIIGILSWFVAVPLSYLLALSLLDGLGFAEFIDFQYPLWVLGLGLVGMVIIAALASLWPALTAARRTVSDILRYQ
ncbi:MAG: FtsX-like permease family protein [Anaerolineae bacterium]|nr:FtsX-like permease family protein [Anaerolineae bacterium]